jgi:hypothetical protein
MNKDKEKNIDINDMAISLDVDKELIAKVRSGEIMHIGIDISENNQNLILENINGNLILVTEEMPVTFHGCYYYNKGEFPYAIKESLGYLVLNGGDDSCIAKIIGVHTEPGIRFNYKGNNKPIVENPNGDSCVWEAYFEVVPVPEEPKHYLMRWNPSISSFTEKDYKDCIANMNNGIFRINWSIYEWEEARRGDFFYMMRLGDDKAGIVFIGQFISDPYPADDWAGTTKRRMYVDMVCMNPVKHDAVPHVSLEKLQNAIPEMEWSKGHSGILLSEDIIKKIDMLQHD